MHKKGLAQGLGLVLLLVLLLLPITECLAEEETFTITTYYPSPYGSYNQLSVYRSVTYKPVNKDTITDPSEGELVYNNADDALYLYNGSKWVGQGVQGGYFLQCGNTCPTGSTRIGPARHGTSVNGVTAAGQTTSDFSSSGSASYYHSSCNCNSSQYLTSGGSTVYCTTPYQCNSTTALYSSDACDTWCLSNCANVSGTLSNISVCKWD